MRAELGLPKLVAVVRELIEQSGIPGDGAAAHELLARYAKQLGGEPRPRFIHRIQASFEVRS